MNKNENKILYKAFLVAALACVGLILVLLTILWLRNEEVEKTYYTTTPTPVVLKQELNRDVVASQWLAALGDIAKQTKDSRTEGIFKVLSEESVVVSPNDNGFSFVDNEQTRNKLRLLPLIPSDKKLSFPLWKRFLQSDIAAAFVSDERVVVIKEDAPISPVFKGLILAHEGEHALRYLSHPYTQHSNKVFSEEERDTHEFVARLMAMIGGVPYDQLLSSEVQRMTTTAKQTEKGMQFQPSGKYHDEMDVIFGPALSDSEKYKREKLLWLDTVFHFVDKYYSGNTREKEDVKAEFLLSIYIAQGMRELEKE